MAPKGIVIQITGDGASAAKALDLVDAHLRETAGQAKGACSEIKEAIMSVRDALETVGITVGISEAIAKMKEMIGASVELGMELGHASKETGISAQNLSVLKYASDVTGVSFEALTKGMGRMSKAMLEAEEGKKAAIQSFARLGISQKEVSDHANDMLGMLGVVADRFQTLPDGPQKAAVAISLFGKAGMQLIPFLDEGSTGIVKLKAEAESLGLVLDEEGVAKLEEMHGALVKLQGGLQGAGLGITVGLEPAFKSMSEVFLGSANAAQGWNSVGEDMGKVLEVAAAAAYGLASAMSGLLAIQTSLIPGMGDFARKAFAEADAMGAKAAAMRDLAQAEKPKPGMGDDDAAMLNRLDPSILGKKPSGHLDLQDQSGKTKKPKDDNKVAEQATALAEANATAEAAAQKSADEVLLAQMDADHKLFLTSDANYYREKLIIQKDAIDAEEAALRTRVADLQALQTRQHADPKLTRDKSGNSAEEEKTATEIVKLNQQINELEGKRATLNVNASLAAQERADAVHLASLKAAAEMEEHTNSGIQARLALMKQEQQLAMQKTTAEGGDTKGLAALQAQEKELLQIADAERQINQVKEQGALQAAALKDSIEKNPSLRKQDTKELNALNEQTAATLKDLVAQYDALAQELGGDFIEKAKALHAEMDTLNRPDKKPDLQPYKTLGDGMTTMAEQMARATGTGRQGFHKMVMSMEQDLVELAVKFAAQKWLAPFLNSLGNGGGGGGGGTADLSPGNFPGFAEGGDYGAGPRIVGEEGPELDFPKGPGTILPNDALQNLSRSGGGGAPNVTMNVTNASSQPVTARQTGSSFDSDMKSFVIHTILEDHANGGPISAASQGSS